MLNWTEYWALPCKLEIVSQGCSSVHGIFQTRKLDWTSFSRKKVQVTQFSSVHFSHSGVWLFPSPCTTARQASMSITNSRSLLKLMSTESVMPSSHLILCRPLLLPPSMFPSIRVFSNESVLQIRWPKYWSFSFSISPSNEYSGLLSLRMDWLDLLAVQVTLLTLESPLKHHSWQHQFFGTQLSL